MKVDKAFMDRAVFLSKKGMESGAGGPFGAVIVKDGEIIGEGHNEVLLSNDPTAHAEIVAVRRACQTLGHFQLTDCVVYTSCEPCPMCLGALYWARPKAIVFACNKDDAAAIGFDDAFIYEELDKKHETRAIPMYGIDNSEAIKVFKLWVEKSDKGLY